MEEAVYIQIAKDIALKITKDEFPEGSILKGRSLLASIYNVSPETIRKAINILAKEKILYVKHGVGVFVDSKAKAIKYLSSYSLKQEVDECKDNIKRLLDEAKLVNSKLSEAFESYEQKNKFQVNESISFFETIIEKDCWIINHTLSEVYFWNYTEATIVAIKRNIDGVLLVSPGPDIPLHEKDKIIFVGKDELSYERVLAFLKYGIQEEE